ncbi:MAG: response regulator transcription factor, partial [Acidimicrobiales bacterium]
DLGRWRRRRRRPLLFHRARGPATGLGLLTVARVLAVDDDAALLRVLRIGLAALGHDILVATNGSQGVSQAAVGGPDVIILDLGLPDMDGLDVVRRIREWSAVPVIVLSADGTEDRKIAALDSGADDYMTKPFGMGELDARLRVALRHRPPESDAEGPTTVTVGPLTLDLVQHQAQLDGRPLDLTAREFSFLAYLARHAGKVCTHRMILEHVWGPRYGTENHYLRVYSYRLRRKLGDPDGALLRTLPGIGYELASDRSDAEEPSR